MQTRTKTSLVFTLILVVLAIYWLTPTIRWISMSEPERRQATMRNDPMIDHILKLGLDLQGGSYLVLEVKSTEGDAVERALEIIRNRIDQLGVSEPLIHREGENWIVVQLPGIKEPERAKELIGKTALLEFRLVNMEKTIMDVLDADGNIDEEKIPDGYEVLPGKGDRRYLIKDTSEITGKYLKNAQVEIGGQFNMPYVSLEFEKEGAGVFEEVTSANIGRNLAIVLDGVVQSAPVIRDRIPGGRAIIEGNFTMEEAHDLAIVLRAGALPAPVEIIQETSVDPSLGSDSVRLGFKASVIGFCLVIIFMVIYYQLSGLLASLALVFNLFFVLGAMSALHATLTMSGIAGLVLTVGMAVDANVLIFERIREELRAGKTVRVSIDNGYSRAFSTILDSNVTTLIPAAFLFQFGTGQIRGFAVTLSLGIVFSMFSAVVITHMIYDIALGGKPIKKLSI